MDVKDRRITLWLALTALAIRLVCTLFFLEPGKHVFSDMGVYDMRAQHLMAWELGPWDTFTPVGYPAFLAFFYKLTDHSFTFIGVVQAFLGAAVVALTHRLALRITSHRWLSLGVGAFCAVHVPFIYYGCFLLSETWFGFALTLGVWLLLEARTEGGWRWKWASAAGLMLGLAASARPNLLLGVPLLPIWFWVTSRRDFVRRAWPVALAAAIPILLSGAFYSKALGRPKLSGTNGGLNFYLNFSEVRLVKFPENGFTHMIAPIPNMVNWTTDEEVPVAFYDDQYFYRRGFALLAERPFRAVRAFTNFVMGFGLGRMHYWPAGDDAWGLRWYSRGFFVVGILPGLLGLSALLWRRKILLPENSDQLMFALLVLTVCLGLYAFLSDPRLRVPFDGFFLLLGADGLNRLLRSRRERPAAEPHPK